MGVIHPSFPSGTLFRTTVTREKGIADTSVCLTDEIRILFPVSTITDTGRMNRLDFDEAPVGIEILRSLHGADPGFNAFQFSIRFPAFMPMAKCLADLARSWERVSKIIDRSILRSFIKSAHFPSFILRNEISIEPYFRG